MEEKKNKGLVWLIVILVILFIGLVYLVVYNTILKNVDKNNSKNTTTTTTITTTTAAKLNIDDIYPKEHSEDVLFAYNLSRLLYNDGEDLVNQNTNFKLQTFKTPEGLEFSVKCSVYDEEEKYCYNLEFNIDDINLEYYDYDGCGFDSYVIKTTDYLFVRENEGPCIGNHGDIKIYKKGNLIYEIKDYADTTDYGDYEMKFHDNKLYFIAVTDESNFKYSLNYIDVSKEKIESIKIMDLD